MCSVCGRIVVLRNHSIVVLKKNSTVLLTNHSTVVLKKNSSPQIICYVNNLKVAYFTMMRKWKSLLVVENATTKFLPRRNF